MLFTMIKRLEHDRTAAAVACKLIGTRGGSSNNNFFFLYNLVTRIDFGRQTLAKIAKKMIYGFDRTDFTCEPLANDSFRVYLTNEMPIGTTGGRNDSFSRILKSRSRTKKIFVINRDIASCMFECVCVSQGATG